MKIVVDSREQEPWFVEAALEGRLPHSVQFKKLHVGDYSVAGHEGRVAVERKSLADLFTTMTAGRARFARECKRAVEAGTSLFLVVERSATEVALGSAYSAVQGRRVLESVMGLSAWYAVRPVFCRTRTEAEMVTLAILSGHLRAWSEPFCRG